MGMFLPTSIKVSPGMVCLVLMLHAPMLVASSRRRLVLGAKQIARLRSKEKSFDHPKTIDDYEILKPTWTPMSLSAWLDLAVGRSDNRKLLDKDKVPGRFPEKGCDDSECHEYFCIGAEWSYWNWDYTYYLAKIEKRPRRFAPRKAKRCVLRTYE